MSTTAVGIILIVLTIVLIIGMYLDLKKSSRLNSIFFLTKNGILVERLPFKIDNPDSDKIFPKLDFETGKTIYPDNINKE